MDFNNFLNKLTYALSKDLPGLDFQIRMLPKGRNSKTSKMPEDVKKSAVLLLIYFFENEFNIVFIKRADDGGRHSGQIAFPGGGYEEYDTDLTETAIRETEEEIGVSEVKVLGILSSIYIPVSNYFVQPVVGILNYKPIFSKSLNEVSEVYSIKLKDIKNANVISKTFEINNQIVTAPFYVFDEFEVWGATAMILSEFIEVLNKTPEY